MSARTLMVQGTASSAGKSLMVTALCRLFARQGLRVAPFKSQNMALNAYVTPDGGEIGRAQAVQAEAAGAPLTVDMNPILLKPEGNHRSQVVVLGKATGSLSAAEYHARKRELSAIVAASLQRLRAAYDLVIIEGAGSPAEINLNDREIVNMHVARLADAPVLLVGDIDRGGVFAALVGTMELIDAADRARVAGFIINKFRGDLSLLESGLRALTARTGVPVLGVVPYIDRLAIADEDSLSLDDRRRVHAAADRAAPAPAPAAAPPVTVAVIRLPRISNHDEFLPLELEPGVRLRFVDDPAEVRAADLVILPGSKSTVSDLAWLREHGLAGAIAVRAGRGAPVLGICGGCQMLGLAIDDPEGVESAERSVPGLGLLPFRTRFRREKTVAQVRARPLTPSFLDTGLPAETLLAGYEIHAGVLEPLAGARPAYRLCQRNERSSDSDDGAVDRDGVVVGTLIHGLLENAALRAALVANFRARITGTAGDSVDSVDSVNSVTTNRSVVTDRATAYDQLADVVRRSLDWSLLRRIVGLREDHESRGA